MANTTLTNAREAKQDEFYTQYYDIEREVEAYLDYNPDVFRGKTVLLPCDDPCVKNRKGVFEYLLGGEQDMRLLDVRVFDEATKRRVYKRQTEEARRRGVSNCPLCAMGHEARRTKLWGEKEMDADHVEAWSRGGTTSEDNCQLLCLTHNRAKGNR